MWFTSGSVTAAKTVKDDAEYSKVTDTLRTDLEAKLTAAASLLEGETKLANLNADGTLATTQSDLESAKTALDAAVSALMPELTFVKTKASAVKTASELEPLVNSALKAELERQVTALDKDHATEATTMLVNLTSLKESLESLQTLVSDGLKMQVDYPQKYYDADNKEAFDAALLKASSVFPAFQWTDESIMVPAPTNGALPNPRAWTKAREKLEFVLQNFIMAPAQAATPTTVQTSPSAAASATVRVAMSEEAAAEAETQTPAPTPAADLASTVSYLKSLNDTLKAATDALNGDNPTEKTAYYKPVDGRTLYWDGFMPKIVVEDYQSAGDGSNKEANKTANQKKLEAWFGDAANWAGLEDQLTKRLGSDKFKNVKLTYASVTLTDFTAGRGVTRWYPTVKFRVEANEGYTLDTNSTREIDIVVRVLYKSAEANADNVFTHEGASPSAAPRGATVNDANVKANVNVYLNYTGPSIVLDEAHPTVGATPNTSINGTSNVTGEFNTKFKKLLVSVFRQGHAESSLFQAVINYVNKFDPKFRAQFVTDSKNGVALTSVQNGTQLRIGSLNDFLYNNKGFLQQVNGDSSAVYFAVNGVTSEGWLNTFLIRIPLTKFVRPITPFTASAVMIPTTEDYQEDSSNAGNTNENTETPVEDQTGQESSESGSTQTDQAQQESPQTQ
ncbi:hypothetical protein [Mycoplasmopsis synoviae]|uniref:Phase-variable hemagglutinin n=5 Tax=Mycoplasmopsis synoviae TaxID=2109 RepID=A0AAX3F151_MYCSY|nr:hypothetical protein [Mycoplasmopsis synoviae]ULL02634.1 hypothetical protein JM201_01235 [Mycoplasmopsis synoviae]UZW64701.1 hypothetical protein OIE46_01305 [Mycoplasmopsis synoviae]